MTPFEEYLRAMSMGGMMPPRPAMPAPQVAPRSPYLTPQQSDALGVGFPTSLMGTEMPGSAQYPGAPREPRMAPTAAPTETPMGGGFAPASQTLPRSIERGKGPFEDFMATYNLGRMPPAAPPPGTPQGPAPEPAAPFYLAGPQSPRQGSYGAGGGMGGGMGGMDNGQMQREAMFAQKYPRAMQRIQQLRGMSQRRGY